MAIVPNNQSFSPAASGILLSSLAPIFRAQMDTVLLGGRDISVDLPPSKLPCLSGCKFNSTYKKYVSTTGSVCNSCKGNGYILETRQTVYRANIRWTNEPFDQSDFGGQDTPAGRVAGNFVRTKTVLSSFNHIVNSIGVTIDGRKCKIFRQPRQIGFGGDLFYLVTWWQEANRNISNG